MPLWQEALILNRFLHPHQVGVQGSWCFPPTHTVPGYLTTFASIFFYALHFEVPLEEKVRRTKTCWQLQIYINSLPRKMIIPNMTIIDCLGN